MNNSIIEASERKFKIGFLSTWDSPLSPWYAEALVKSGCTEITVICDSKTITEKDKFIWEQRTNSAFPIPKDMNQFILHCKNLGLSFEFFEDHNGLDTFDFIKSNSFDVLLNTGTPRRLKQKVLSSSQRGVVNIHPGILPNYRGCSAVEWAIYNDEQVGNTAHFMTPGYDEGPIIATQIYQFSKKASYQDIRVEVYKNGITLAAETINLLKQTNFGISDAVPQDQDKAKYWDPIPDTLLALVKSKIETRNYKYQK
jgi:hypothetical protein